MHVPSRCIVIDIRYRFTVINCRYQILKTVILTSKEPPKIGFAREMIHRSREIETAGTIYLNDPFFIRRILILEHVGQLELFRMNFRGND